MILALTNRKRDRRAVAAIGHEARLEFGERRARVHDRDAIGNCRPRQRVDAGQFAPQIAKQRRRPRGQYCSRTDTGDEPAHHIAGALHSPSPSTPTLPGSLPPASCAHTSDDRRGGKEGVSTGNSRRAPSSYKKKLT